jgi:hypothetical protein
MSQFYFLNFIPTKTDEGHRGVQTSTAPMRPRSTFWCKAQKYERTMAKIQGYILFSDLFKSQNSNNTLLCFQKVHAIVKNNVANSGKDHITVLGGEQNDRRRNQTDHSEFTVRNPRQSEKGS